MVINFNNIINQIKNIYDSDHILLHEPFLKEDSGVYVRECIETGWVSTAGDYVGKFERMIADFAGTKYAIATINGTAALHLSLLINGVSRGDEVLCPALTFVATANAIRYCGADPVFIDSSWDTLGMSPSKVSRFIDDNVIKKKNGYAYNRRTGKRIKACVPVHVYGHPVDLDPLIEICKVYNISLIEDAAEALGSLYKGKYCGTFGKMGIFSFNGNKIITTGGGGMIVTDDEELAQRANHLSLTAKVPHKWESNHNDVGFNYKLPGINAALGCAQMDQLEYFIKLKRKLAEYYDSIFKECPEMRFFLEQEWAESNYWLNTVIFSNKNDRDKFLRDTNNQGIMARPPWKMISDLPMYRDCPRGDLNNTKEISDRIANIPSSLRHLKIEALDYGHN